MVRDVDAISYTAISPLPRRVECVSILLPNPHSLLLLLLMPKE